MSNRDNKGRFVAKGITEVVPAEGAAKAETSTSIVGRSAQYKALSPRQAYENNIHVRRCISVIANDVAKAQGRLFSMADKEVVTGDAYDFVRRWLTPDALASLASWFLAEGEMAMWKIMTGTKLSGLRVIDPAQLMAEPAQVRHLDDVTRWQFFDGYAISASKPSVQLEPENVAFAANWNPNHPFRGLAPAVSGVTEITTNYFSGRYNAQFFQNGAASDIIIRFPKGTDQQTARDFVQKWESRHGHFNAGAFKVGALIGQDIQVETPGTTARDGKFLELRGKNAEDIAALYGVPPILINPSNAKFDSATEQLEAYYENTLMPLMRFISTYIQTQIIDPHFTSTNTDKKDVRLFGRTVKALESGKAKSRSGLVYLLDPESLPIAAKLRADQLDTMDKHRRVTGSSFEFSAQWAGVDRESNEADKLVYVPNDQQLIPSQQPAPAAAPAAPQVDPNEVKALREQLEQLTYEKALDEAERDKLDRLKAFYVDYRSLVLANAVEHKTFDKQAALKLAELHGVDTRVRVRIAEDHLDISGGLAMGEQVDLKAYIKQKLNAASKTNSLKALLRGEQ